MNYQIIIILQLEPMFCMVIFHFELLKSNIEVRQDTQFLTAICSIHIVILYIN